MTRTLTVIAVVGASAATAGSVPVTPAGKWQVQVGPGTALLPGGRTVTVKQTVVTVPEQDVVSVRGEKHGKLPVYIGKERYAGWRRGTRLRELITQECSAAGALDAASVRVTSADGGAGFARDADWCVDPMWASLGRTEGGKIGAETAVLVDYEYYPNRLHSLAVDAKGNVRLVVGEPKVGIQHPPELAEGEASVANIWLSGKVEALTEENIFPVTGSPPPTSEWSGAAAKLCPKTMAKLRNGKAVSIVAWGDSVTRGGGVGGKGSKWYQNIFAERLRQRFPKATITLKTSAWPGGNSRGYMTAPPGGKYDFKRDVLDPKPDLVTIEFVNDAGWAGERLNTHYTKILNILRDNGSEIILITPHFVRPDWMRVKTQKIDEDPRPYVKSLRAFARTNGIAVADAAQLWCHLWRQGIPYMTLEGNSINHPDARGHQMFADALMDVFPPK